MGWTARVAAQPVPQRQQRGQANHGDCRRPLGTAGLARPRCVMRGILVTAERGIIRSVHGPPQPALAMPSTCHGVARAPACSASVVVATPSMTSVPCTRPSCQ